MKKLGSGLRAPQEQSARRLFSEASFLAFRCLFELEPGPGPRRGGGEEHFGSTFVKAGFLGSIRARGPAQNTHPPFPFCEGGGQRTKGEGRALRRWRSIPRAADSSRWLSWSASSGGLLFFRRLWLAFGPTLPE